MMTKVPALEVRSLNLRFGGVVALDDLDLTITEGETRCVIGPNGAGKTTLLNVICGLVTPDSGELRVEGERLTGSSPSEVARDGVLRSFQTATVFAGLPVSVNVDLGARRPGTDVSTAPKRAERVMKEFGFEGREGLLASKLSHGERKRLELAMIMASEPRILLLDEPTTGLGIGETNEVVEILKKHCDEMTVVIVEHDMSFVRQIADRVSVLHRGALLMEGSIKEVQADDRVQDVYLGGRVS
jgi:ABC-type uncharacterized transport system ATPase subunit